MNTPPMDPTAEQFCRILAAMLVDAAKNGVRPVNPKRARQRKTKNGLRGK